MAPGVDIRGTMSLQAVPATLASAPCFRMANGKVLEQHYVSDHSSALSWAMGDRGEGSSASSGDGEVGGLLRIQTTTAAAIASTATTPPSRMYPAYSESHPGAGQVWLSEQDFPGEGEEWMVIAAAPSFVTPSNVTLTERVTVPILDPAVTLARGPEEGWRTARPFVSDHE